MIYNYLQTFIFTLIWLIVIIKIENLVTIIGYRYITLVDNGDDDGDDEIQGYGDWLGNCVWGKFKKFSFCLTLPVNEEGSESKSD